MSWLFDGISTVLSDLLGAPVVYIKRGHLPLPTQTRLRHDPVEIPQLDGPPILTTSPTWSVPKDLVPQLARGDMVIGSDGRRYTIQSVHPSGSPARDATVVCVLLERDSQESGL